METSNDAGTLRPPLVPGEDGTPLPSDEWVIRVAAPASDGSLNEATFNLTGRDKKSIPVRLSVYAERLTSHEQAWRLTGSRRENSQVYLLNTDKIREIASADESSHHPKLDVDWEVKYLVNNFYEYNLNELGERMKDASPGAIGHCGIRHMFGTPSARSRIRRELIKIVQACNLPEELLSSQPT